VKPLLGLVLCCVLGGCGIVDRVVPQASVVLYGRTAAAPATSWFAITPVTDPPQSVGFGTDGVACLHAAIGSQLVRMDRSPGPGAAVVGVIAPIDDTIETFWVDIAADGGVTNGVGVPAWWIDAPPAC
jgi:hypothetical protein